MGAYLYPISLAIISLFVFGLEWLLPQRPEQRQFRSRLWSDGLHLVFNGHFLGVILYSLATVYVLPELDAFLKAQGLYETVYRNLASSWSLAAQIVVALLVTDLIHWCVHNLLHRVPVLWELHKTHHSVVDGEMDWIVAFRFQWTEVVVYKMIQYLPLAFFGFGIEAVMVHAIFGTLIGHLNHANVKLDYGPLKYVLNSPKMHIWHHNYDIDKDHPTVNFGVIFSIWDWVFGTAYMPENPPRKIGFEGVDAFPKTFFGQAGWPVQRLFEPGPVRLWAGIAAGAAVLGAGLWAVFF